MKTGSAILSLFVLLALLLVASGCTQSSSPAVPALPEETAAANETLVAFVEEAVAYAHAHGKDAALAEFNDPNGSFVRGELYIYAYDFNGTTIAHPVNPEKVGVNRLDEPDAFGHPYGYQIRDVAYNGSGYVWFYYINPVHNNAVEKKLGYVTKVDDDWWLGSGIYHGPIEPAVASSPDAPSTAGDIKDFVDAAASYARTNGKDAALAEFSNASGRFAAGDVYVYALDYAGNALALVHQPDLVGTNFLNLRDASGKYYTRTEIGLAQAGGGYLLYRYPDPAENYTIRYKISYVSPVEDAYWIGAGIYTREDLLIDRDLGQFIADAKTYATTNGRTAALAEFNDPNGSFIKDDLYVFAYDYNGTTLSWPYRPDLIGVNRLNATDAMGAYHIRAMIDTARNGGGMVDYYSVNPRTNDTALKIGYVTDVDGTWLLGAGRYVEPDQTVLRG